MEKPEMVHLNGEKWIRIVPGDAGKYHLYNALAEDRNSLYLGRILFDPQMNWIYDGEQLRIPEQEELAGYITNYANDMNNLMDSLKESRVKTLRTDSNDPDFRLLIGELDNDLRERNGELMDVYDQHNIIEYTGFVVLGYYDGELAGCGCFKEAFNDAAEIKRMYVRRAFRGKGISAAILRELEDMAVKNGYSYTILETGSRQVEALGLYRKAGYSAMPNYGPYTDLPDSICFKKRLV
jgi:GNAT superfamily N-acetyltransferase